MLDPRNKIAKTEFKIIIIMKQHVSVLMWILIRIIQFKLFRRK